MAHTPGPWTLSGPIWRDPDSRIYRISTRIEPAGRLTIAQVEDLRELGDTAANARLIALSPELFKVCGYLLEAVEMLSPGHCSNLIDETRELIAKVERRNA